MPPLEFPNYIVSYLNDCVNNSFIVRCFAVYLFCNAFHYGCTHLYVQWCAPYTFYGFITSSYLVISPQCVALRWALYNGANQIGIFWGFIGGCLIARIETIWKV